MICTVKKYVLQMLILAQLLIPHVFAAEAKQLELSAADGTSIQLTEYFSVLEDPSLDLTINDVKKTEWLKRFRPATASPEGLNFGYTRSAYWLQLKVNNASQQTMEKLLEIAYSRLSQVEIHLPDPAGTYHSIATGSVAPFTDRPYKNRNFVFPVTFPAATEQVIYIRVQALSSMLIPARLWEPNAFHAYARNDYLVQAWYFGMVSAMLVFNLLLYFALRDVIYLLYVNFIFAGALSIAAQNGLAKEFLWQESPGWSDISTTVIYSLALMSLMIFMRHMLNTWQVLPRTDRLLKFLIGFFLIYPVGFLVSPHFLIRITAPIYFVGMSIVLATGVYCAINKQRSAIFFVAAFTVLLLGGVMTALRLMSLLPANFITLNGMQMGSALEMLMLAFALADRFNEIRREKAKAQREALEAQTNLVDGLKASERLLEERVERRTEALQKSNAALNEAYKIAETSRDHAESARQQATQALNDLRTAQTQLVQSEKMASLGQLVSNIAHEINTPIGAVKSSGKNIADALDYSLMNMPRVLQRLNTEEMERFLELIGRANSPRASLSTRDERSIKREVAHELEEQGIGDARHKADMLVQLNAQLAVRNYLPLLRHTDTDLIMETAYSIAKIVNNTSNINTAVERVSKIIHALKSFSRPDSTSEKSIVNLRDELETVLTLYQSHIRLGTEVVRRYEEVPPLRCLPTELNQVWTNLIHNALQAMEYKGVLTVAIRLENGHAVVSVSDSGCGIPEEIREKIFDPFFTTKPEGEGSGLGLNVVKKSVDKHQGKIEIQSQVGIGTTFNVYLPYLNS